MAHHDKWLRHLFDTKSIRGDKTKLAKAMNMSSSTLSKLLSGERQIKVHEMAIITDYFNVENPGIVTVDQKSGQYEYTVEEKTEHRTSLHDSRDNQTEQKDWMVPDSIAHQNHKAVQYLRVTDNAMEPEFSKGEIVAVDGGDLELPGVFMISDGYSRLVRQCELIEKPGMLTQIRISAYSKHFIPQILDEDDIQILGRVTLAD